MPVIPNRMQPSIPQNVLWDPFPGYSGPAHQEAAAASANSVCSRTTPDGPLYGHALYTVLMDLGCFQVWLL